MADAACLDEPSFVWFEPAYENDAKRVCGRCDVQPDCLAHALVKGETVGVWGGKTEREREAIIHAAAVRAHDA